jgi:hypothetical protein
MDDTARSIGDRSDADVDRRTREIRRDIEHTRGEMSETIEAIEEKLRPGNIVSSATERVRNAATERMRNMKESAEQAYERMRSGASNSGEGLMDDVRRNPIPVALIGVGAAWLFFGSRSKSGSRRNDSYGSMSTRGGMVNSAMEGEEVRYERARRMPSQLQRLARENPLMVGAAALLLGSAVGLAIPETEKENEWLGETRDSVLDKAQQMARTTAARAQEAAADLAGDAASRMVGGTPE